MKTNIRRYITWLVGLVALSAAPLHAFYEPNLQRWLNPDPIGEAGGINLYQFVGNDPVIKIDPDAREGLQYYQAPHGQWTARGPDVNLTPEGAAAVGLMGASMVPGVGEAMDLHVPTDPKSKWWERALAGTSLSLNTVTAGFLPNAGGLLRGGKLLCEVPGAGSLVRSSLPDLPSKFAREFEGPVRTRTFKAGEKIYRSPWLPKEMPNNPGSWFGTRRTATRTGTDSLYQINKWNNPNQVLRA